MGGGDVEGFITKLASREIDVETYQLLAASLFERFRDVVKVFEFTEVAIVVESSSNYDRLANQYLFADKEKLLVRVGEVEHEMALSKFLLSKNAGVCGLQVADAIVNTAGGQARARRKGATKPNKNFLAVFGEGIDSRWKSYMEITRVTEPGETEQ